MPTYTDSGLAKPDLSDKDHYQLLKDNYELLEAYAGALKTSANFGLNAYAVGSGLSFKPSPTYFSIVGGKITPLITAFSIKYAPDFTPSPTFSGGGTVTYNTTYNYWLAGSSANVYSPIGLDTLGDVAVASKVNGQFLTYNATTNKWNNTTITRPTAIGALTDVTGLAATINNLVYYNGTRWTAMLKTSMANDDFVIPVLTGLGLQMTFNGTKWAALAPTAINAGLKAGLTNGSIFTMINTNTNGHATNSQGILAPPGEIPILREYKTATSSFSGTIGAASEGIKRYEEGTFIPAFGNTVGNFTRQEGRYVVMGRNCNVMINLEWDSTSTSGAAITITGLPFVSSATGLVFSGVVVLEGVTHANPTVMARLVGGANTANVYTYGASEAVVAHNTNTIPGKLRMVLNYLIP